MNEDKDVRDFFSEELNKKEKKLQKQREKERKKLEKKNKKLEKKEDIEFAKQLEEKNKEELEMTRSLKFSFNVKKEKKYPILNFFLGLFLILLFLVSCDYFIYSILKETDIELIITSSLLLALSFFYILSIIIKNERAKKIFQILATISIGAYMIYQLFII